MSKPLTIDPKTLETLNEIVKWWRDQHGSLGSATIVKPLFKKPEASAFRSLRLPKEMMIAAILKAHRDGISNFNELVKILLWRYLGQDPKYILQDPD